MLARILVVDDEPSIVDVLTRFLTREGYSVVAASNGREAAPGKEGIVSSVSRLVRTRLGGCARVRRRV